MESQRDVQAEYLARAQKRGMRKILCDLKRVSEATSPDRRGKYVHLLTAIANLGLLRLPDERQMGGVETSSQGWRNFINGVEIGSSFPAAVEVIFVLPESLEQANCIGIEHVAGVVKGRGEIGRCFATYLRKWSRQKAGSRPR